MTSLFFTRSMIAERVLYANGACWLVLELLMDAKEG